MNQPPNPPQGWWQPPADDQAGQQGWQQQTPPPQQAQGYQQRQAPPHQQIPPHQQVPPHQQGPQSQPVPQQQWPATPGAGQPYPQQYAQQPNQQAGYGGGYQPSSYGGLGAYGESEQQKPKRSKKPLLVGGAVGLVLVGGVVAAWLLGAFRGPVLDQNSLQDGVTSVLRDNYGEQDVKNAQCPDDQPVANGTTFECTVDVAGQPKNVAIRVLNDKPEFEVGAPK
ncbi:hypothetical protein CFN78_01490 [Amycolatopsis antarctica]|uniref:DUF4333 domain-containing protein n=1 Tax=Amycolatopsis antarctica TaxID=1854586 RepID=A0A263DBZ2_9PSEU|nr:DUF4333 domain-containing protein [Amycolatopsis antarctica]OZM74915.1 hypothetical protein CFN78_01490 [Amycolatopsis antarctica]